MQARAAAIAYKKVFLDSAPPTRVLDELYGRLLLDLEQAKEGIIRKDIPARGVGTGLQHVARGKVARRPPQLGGIELSELEDVAAHGL